MSRDHGERLTAEIAQVEQPGSGEFRVELRLSVPSDVARVEEAVDIVTRHLEAHVEDRHSIRFNVRVALAEAISNAILYGNRSDPRKHVEVKVWFGRSQVVMEVADEGEGFDHAAVPDPTLPERVPEPDGRGIFLIRRLVDEVRFNERGNSIWMALRRA